MSKIMSMQRPQLQNKLNIVMGKMRLGCSLSSDNMHHLELRMMPQNLTEMIGMSISHLKITAATTSVLFLAVFWLGEYFSGGFSVNAKNIKLGGKIRQLGSST